MGNKKSDLWIQNILWCTAELAFLWLRHVVYRLYLNYLQYNHTTEKVLHIKYEEWKYFQEENITDANMHYKC